MSQKVVTALVKTGFKNTFLKARSKKGKWWAQNARFAALGFSGSEVTEAKLLKGNNTTG